MIGAALFFVLCVEVFVICQDYNVPENIDIDQIIKNDRLLKNYVDCLLERGKCTPEGEQLKKTIPDALENECKKCGDTLKSGVRKVVYHLIEKKQGWWKELEAKYDPKGEYKQRYHELIKSEGLIL